MSVKIRLSRIGKKHIPFHRIIVVDSRKKRDAAYLANLGTYDAQKSQVVTFNEDLYNQWIAKGAQPTDSAHKIYKQFKKIGLEALAQKTKATKTQAAPKQEVVVEATEVTTEKPAEAAQKTETKETAAESESKE